MTGNSFKELYCARFGCPPEQFEDHLLRHCMHERGKRLAELLLKWFPDHFRADRALIHDLEKLKDVEAVGMEVKLFRERHPVHGLLARRMHVRVSGQCLVNTAVALFGQGVVIQPNNTTQIGGPCKPPRA